MIFTATVSSRWRVYVAIVFCALVLLLRVDANDTAALYLRALQEFCDKTLLPNTETDGDEVVSVNKSLKAAWRDVNVQALNATINAEVARLHLKLPSGASNNSVWKRAGFTRKRSTVDFLHRAHRFCDSTVMVQSVDGAGTSGFCRRIGFVHIPKTVSSGTMYDDTCMRGSNSKGMNATSDR